MQNEHYLDNINHIASLLADGAVILCPTDTIWGLSCDATSSHAVEKIYKIKKRDRNKPFILLVDNIARLRQYTTDIHPRIETLISFYNKPLTIIHKASSKLPATLTDKTGHIAIRVCKHPLIQEIIYQLDRPLVSTSANLEGQTTPKLYHEIAEVIKNQVQYSCQSYRSSNGAPNESTIVKYTNDGELIFLR